MTRPRRPPRRPSPAPSPPIPSTPAPVTAARRSTVGKRWFWAAGLAALLVALTVLAWRVGVPATRAEAVEFEFPEPNFATLTEPKIRELCSRCHLFPAPDILPREQWSTTIWQMYVEAGYGRTVPWPLAPAELIAWYEQRAPEHLPVSSAVNDAARGAGEASPPTVEFHQRNVLLSDQPHPFTSDIQIANVLRSDALEVVVCDMHSGAILLAGADSLLGATQRGPAATVGHVTHPARVHVVDLDQDGRQDLVVADLGSFMALDHNLGSVVWLRQTDDATFEPIPLATQLGRVADVQTDDIDGDGDLDLLVAEFGWKFTGHVIVFENESTAPGDVRFSRHDIDGLAGAMQIAAGDFDHDGRRDMLVLYSQQHEMLRYYLQRGEFVYEVVDIHRAPHPAWGYTGFQLADLDGDDDLDVLLTNGDMFDNSIVKPYHGIEWLENQGALRFEPQWLTALPGAYRAVAADVDNDGDQDIVACALVENPQFIGDASRSQFDGLIWLEQTHRGQFVRHAIDRDSPQHATLAIADLDRDGWLELLVGAGEFQAISTAAAAVLVEVWRTPGETP